MDIFDAIIGGDVYELRKILESDNDAKDVREYDNLTPLHFAVTYRTPEVVRLLLEFGADIYAVNDDDLTPLDCALELNNKEIVDIFVKHIQNTII